MQSFLPDEFRVQIVFNNDILNELEAERPSDEMIERYRIAFESNKIKFKASMFMEKRKPGRPPKQKQPIIEESIEDEISDGEEDVPEDEFEEMDLEGDMNQSISSKEKKFTKRQLHSMGNLEVEELLQLPTKTTKSKKELAFTEEEMIIKSMKELQRREKLQRQQEEQKQMTVDKILNEVGRKQKQRLQQEDKKTEDTHKYRTLPPGDTVIKYKSNSDGNYFLVPNYVDICPQKLPPKPYNNCSQCNVNKARYQIKNSQLKACSLECYKLITLK